jgi:hypothetical protein
VWSGSAALSATELGVNATSGQSHYSSSLEHHLFLKPITRVSSGVHDGFSKLLRLESRHRLLNRRLTGPTGRTQTPQNFRATGRLHRLVEKEDSGALSFDP